MFVDAGQPFISLQQALQLVASKVKFEVMSIINNLHPF